MPCFYWKGDKKFYTESDLISEYLEKNSILSSAAIFSSDQVQNSAITELRKLHKPELFGDENYTSVLDLISKPNKQLFTTIKQLEDVERLVPEYIEANRIRQFIIDNINSVVNFPDDVKYNTNTLSELMLDPKISTYEEGKVKYLLSQIEQEIETEDKTKEISIMLHKILSSYLDINNNLPLRSIFNKHFKEDRTDLYGTDNKELWYNKIASISNIIKEKIEKIGVPISDLRLVTHEDSKLNVYGQIDLVAIDSTGGAHIFDIVTSKRSFNSWDSAKKLNYDWSLAIKRQLIGQALPIEDVQLYIIPLIVQSLENPNTVSVDDFQNRTNDPMAGLKTTGWISVIAEKLIPRRIITKYDPARAEKLKESLNTIISDSYEIKTELEENDVDTIIKNAEKRFEKTNSWSKYNKYEDVEGEEKGYIEEKPTDNTKEAKEIAKEKFRRRIEKYVEFVKTQENRGVSILQDAIISSIKTNQPIKTSQFSSKRDNTLNHLLNDYLNDDWEVVKIPEARAMGIVVLRNKFNNIVNIFNISVKQFYASSKLDNYLHGDLDVIKAMVFVNEFKEELFPNEAYKLGQIITFNPRNADSYYKTPQQALRMFKDRVYKTGATVDIKIQDKDLLGIEDVALNNFISALKTYDGRFKDKIDRIANIIGDGHLDSIDKTKLIEARAELLREFPTYINKTTKPELNFDDPIEVILALLQVALLTKEGLDPQGDFQHLTKYSLQAADFRSLIKSIYTQDMEQYDETGKKVQWLIGGLTWTNPEYVQSKDLRQINGLISTGNSFIGERMVKMNNITSLHTKKYYEAIQYNTFERMTWGESQSKHENLFILDDTGRVSKEFKTKNPYKVDEINALEPYEREYLQNLLLIINQYKYGIPDVEIEKMDATNLDSIRQNQTLAEALDKGTYFEMPLIRREELSKYKDAFTSMSDRWKGMAKDTITELLDGRELSEQDVENIDAQKMGFFEMYDVYGHQEGEARAKMIEQRGTNYYELNLDTIAHRVAFNKIRKQTFDLILPTINAYMWWIKLIGAKQNVDVSNQLEYVVNQIKLAIFDEPLINDEQKTLAKGLSFARQISTVAMLAFRPALLAKEMTIGVLKNFSASALGVNEEFGSKEMTLAYSKLLTIDNKFTDEFNMIDRLNQMYRMANMDISSMAKKIQTDRWGVAKGAGRYMFMTSTAADYYNRMAILLSKMIKDGSYEAHSMVDGALVYDVTKDKRYSYYLSEREKHKDKNGNYTTKKGDEKYNYQRNRYLLTIEQMNKEGAVVNQKKLEEKDLIQKAYSQQERSSIKSYSDLMYGAYDKDWQAQFSNTILGIAFMQFMTYWPNKMRLYFGKHIEAEDSPIGKITHAYEEVDGEKKYKYWETVERADGTTYRTETFKNTGDPLLSWQGTPQEGLFVSVMYTAQDIIKGNWTKVKDNELRRNRTLFALSDAALIALILWIMKALYSNLKKENGRDSLSGEAIHFMDTVNNKVLNEYDVWGNTFGAIKTEPLFLSYFTRVLEGTHDAVTGDRSLRQVLGQNVGALEWMK